MIKTATFTNLLQTALKKLQIKVIQNKM